MRTKILIFILILASLACTANVSVLTTPVVSQATTSTVVVDVTPPVSAPPLEGLPIVIATEITMLRMLDFQNGWMITNHFVLRTMDGAATWHDVTPPGASKLGYGTGASFLDSNHGWILIGDTSDPVDAGTLYQTDDGGVHWSANPVPFGGADLHFLDDANGWIMLNAANGAGNMAMQFYQTYDGGANWMQVYSNLTTDPGASDSLPFIGMKSGFTPVSMQEAWVGGHINNLANNFYLYHTVDGGRNWSAVTADLPVGDQAMYLTYPPVFFGSQIGLLPTLTGKEGSSTFFFITRDGGGTWTPGAAVPGAGYSSIVSPNDVFLLFSGAVSVSHDATQTWTEITPNVDLNAYLVIAFQFVDTQTGWVVLSDENGHTSLYKTTDGGQTWAAQVP